MKQDDGLIIDYLQAIFGDQEGVVTHGIELHGYKKTPCYSIHFTYEPEGFTGSEHKAAFTEHVRNTFEVQRKKVMDALGLKEADVYGNTIINEEKTSITRVLQITDEALSRALPKLRSLKRADLGIPAENTYLIPNQDFERDDAVESHEQYIPKSESHRLLQDIFGDGTVQYLDNKKNPDEEYYSINFDCQSMDLSFLRNKVRAVANALCQAVGIPPETREYVDQNIGTNETTRKIFLYLPVEAFEEQSVQDKLVDMTADQIGLTKLLQENPIKVQSSLQLTTEESDVFGENYVVGQHLHDSNTTPAEETQPRARALEKLQSLFDRYKEVDWVIDPDKEAFVLKRNDGKPMHEPAIIAYYLLEDMQKDVTTADTYAEKGCVVLPFHLTDTINGSDLAIHTAYARAMDALQPTHLLKRRPRSAAGQGLG